MNTKPSDPLTIRDYSVGSWLFGGFFLACGLWLFTKPQATLTAVIFSGLGFVIAVLANPVSSIKADKVHNKLTISRNWLVYRWSKQIPLYDVASVDIDASRGRRTTYRIVVNTVLGEKLPMTFYYTGGFNGKQKKASQLNEYLSLERQPSQEADLGVQEATQVFQRAYQAVQNVVTDGVTWRVETAPLNAGPVTRWVSPNFKFPGQFLYLGQKQAGSKLFSDGGLLGSLTLMALRQVLRFYGFSEQDLPGLESAGRLTPLDEHLAQYYDALTSDQTGARQLLTPWVVTPLAQWAEKNPVKQFQMVNPDSYSQLVVLFSPNGLYIVSLTAPTDEHLQALANLGVELVRALGPLPTST